MSHSSVLHIAVITDEGYVVPTVTMLSSARYNKKTESIYCIHVLGNNLSEFAKSKFMELARPDFDIRLYSCSDARYSDVRIPPNASFNKSCMIKCEIAERLSQLDKVLFVDGDALVMGDLGELYGIDLGDNILAAVREVAAEKQGLHEMIGTEYYFNTGVMLLNLSLMREEGIGEKVIQTKFNDPDTWVLAEQDPFNVVCAGRTLFLPPRWNFFSTLSWSIEEFNDFYHTSYSSYTEMEANAVIQHFAAIKPWKNNALSHASLWQKYHDMSPFGNTSLTNNPNYPVNIYHARKINVYLFGLIPILRIKVTVSSFRVHFFGIPVLKMIWSDEGYRLLLFSHLPLFSWRNI